MGPDSDFDVTGGIPPGSGIDKARKRSARSSGAGNYVTETVVFRIHAGLIVQALFARIARDVARRR
jgi:hypothetical protein